MCLHCILIRYLIKITPRMSHFSYLTFNVIYWIIVYAVFKVHSTARFLLPNGDGEIRTLDPLLARQVLSQLSYTPI